MHHTNTMALRQLLRVQKERDLMGYTITRYLRERAKRKRYELTSAKKEGKKIKLNV